MAFAALGAGLFTILRTDTEASARAIGDFLLFRQTRPTLQWESHEVFFRGEWCGCGIQRLHTGTELRETVERCEYESNGVRSHVLKILTRPHRSTDRQHGVVALFEYFNQKHGKGNIGYTPGEKIAVKINLNNVTGNYNPGNLTFASPQALLGLLWQLVTKSELPTATLRCTISSGTSRMRFILNARQNFHTCT